MLLKVYREIKQNDLSRSTIIVFDNTKKNPNSYLYKKEDISID